MYGRVRSRGRVSREEGEREGRREEEVGLRMDFGVEPRKRGRVKDGFLRVRAGTIEGMREGWRRRWREMRGSQGRPGGSRV